MDLGHPVQCLGERGRSARHDEHVLDVDPPAGVGTAAEDLDLGDATAIDVATAALPPRLANTGDSSSASIAASTAD
jgi:hypothetical protein